MPRKRGRKNSRPISGRISPRVWVRWLAKPRAAARGTNASSSMTARTRSAVSGATGVFPFNTRLTVAIETPAWRATSEIVRVRLENGIYESVFRKRFHIEYENIFLESTDKCHILYQRQSVKFGI